MAEYETHVFTHIEESLEKIVLENITSVTLNTDVLKINFEAIVSILKGLVKKVNQGNDDSEKTSKDVRDLKDRLEKLEEKQNSDKNELNDKIFNNQEQIKTVESETNQNTQDIQKLQDSLRELKENQDNFAKISENDWNAVKQKLEQHDKQIQELFDKIAEGNNNNNTDKLNDQIAEIHKLLEDFVKKDEFNGYKDQTNNKLQSHQDSIDDLYNQLKDIKALVSDKLSCETFDEHLVDYNNIKNIVIGLANNNGDKNVVQQIVQSGPALSTKDANLLKELGQKFPELENLVKKIQKDLNDHLLNYRTFSDDTTKKIQNNEESLKSFKIEINKRIAELEAAFKSLRDQILNFNSAPSTAGSGESSADLRKIQIALNSLTERVDNIEKELLDLRGLKNQVNNLQDASNEHRQKISGIEEELIDLKSLKARIEMLEQLLRDREKDAHHKSKQSKGGSFENGVTIEQVKQIVDEEINKLRDEIMAILEELRALIERKADMDDLMKSEAALLEKLDQIAGALMKRADRKSVV